MVIVRCQDSVSETLAAVPFTQSINIAEQRCLACGSVAANIGNFL